MRCTLPYLRSTLHACVMRPSELQEPKLALLMQVYGARNWSLIAGGIKGRSGKSCRLRWCNQLNPDVIKEPFSEWEDAVIINAHKVLFSPPCMRQFRILAACGH